MVFKSYFGNYALLKWILLLLVFVCMGFLFGVEAYKLAVSIIAIPVLVFVFLKIFEDPFRGVLAVTFFLPFERLPTFELSGYTIKISYILASITFFVWIIKSLGEKKFNLKIGIVPIIAIIFLLISLISIVNTPNLSRSLLILGTVTFMFLIMVLFLDLIDSKEKLQKTIKVLLFSTFLVLIFGFYQYLGDIAGLSNTFTGIREAYSKVVFGFPRFQSVGLEPLNFANFLLLPIGIIIGLIAGNLGSKQEKINYFLLLFLSILALFLTVSRGAYLGFFGMLIIFIFLRFRNLFSRRILNIIIKVSLSVILASILFFQLTPLGNRAFSVIGLHLSPYSSRGSIAERLERSQIAINEWTEHPVIGNGIGSFGPLFAENPHEIPEGGWMTVSNQYLEVLTEQGIIGLIIFIIFIGSILCQGFRAYNLARDRYLKFIALGSTLALIGILIQYNLFSTLYIIHLWVLFAIILISSELIQKDIKEKQTHESKGDR